MGGDVSLCTMCDEEPATTSFGAPVCEGCREWLVGLQGELAEMEGADPDLARKGRAVDEAAQRLFATAERRAKKRAENVRRLRRG